jgi:prephenate dehydrogenase
VSETENDRSEAPLRPALVERVALFGLGLIGGSVARATRRAWPDAELVGVDRGLILDVARDKDIIDDGVEPDDAGALVESADLVILCLPVLAIIDTIERLAKPLATRAVITDTGSTKGSVLEAARLAGLTRFVGGHPMAGKAAGGLAHADADLFDDATWFLCPGADVPPEATRLLREWVAGLGARPVEIDAAEHDRAVALTSQLPHLLVNALAESVLEMGVLDAAGGSLREVLGVAGAPFDVWGDTITTNRRAIDDALEEIIGRLEDVRARLGERNRMRDLFARGRACRGRVRSSG